MGIVSRLNRIGTEVIEIGILMKCEYNNAQAIQMNVMGFDALSTKLHSYFRIMFQSAG